MPQQHHASNGEQQASYQTDGGLDEPSTDGELNELKTDGGIDESNADGETDETGLTAGVARRDITPEMGRGFQGYVRPDMRADGVAIRPFARALVLADGERKVALVSADLLYGIDKEGVLERVRPLGFRRETLLYAGTHTHCSSEAGEWTTEQVASAIEAADAAREPAVAGWGSAEVESANHNRSLEAHLANHGLDLYPGTGSLELDPEGPAHPRDTTLSLLRVDSESGDPIAAWAQFAVHPTAFSPHNTLYTADLAGVALRRFREAVPDAFPLFANRASGDLIPVYDDYNDYAVADSVGRRIADGMVTAWERAGESLGDLSVAGRARTVTYDGQEVEPGKRVGSRSVFGLPFFGGAENGPSFFYTLGLEGTRRPAVLADSVHGRKIPVLPAPWDADVEVQVLRVGRQLLLAVPGEPTVEMARRSVSAVTEALAETVGTDEYGATVLGLVNDYNGYFTTPEEYDQQHYEGGHTTFGKHSEALLRTTFVEIATDMLEHPKNDPTPISVQRARTLQTDVDAPVGTAGDGRLVRGPSGPVERLSTVTVVWEGVGDGRDRPIDDPFIRLERQVDADEAWETVATDLGLGFVWMVEGNRYTARYDLPRDIQPGEYRFRVTSAGTETATAGGYELTTDPFEVVPATNLRVRGVELAGDETLVFRGQYPPPNPEKHLRTRPISPDGGTVTFTVDGDEYAAEWDDTHNGWVATVPGVSSDDAVQIPTGGLEDGVGNRSSGPTTVRVGDVAEVEWPPNRGPAGGRPPGPFGIGTWPF